MGKLEKEKIKNLVIQARISHLEMFYKKGVLRKFCKSYRKIPVSETLS